MKMIEKLSRRHDMSDLLLYLGVTAIGYMIGAKFKHIVKKITWTEKVQTLSMVILIVLMGMRMGSNEEIIQNLSTIGVSAFLMTIAVLTGSVGAIIVTRKLLGIDRHGMLVDKDSAEVETKSDFAISSSHSAEGQGMNMMTIVIVISVVIGMALGYFFIRHHFYANMEVFENFASLGIKTGLCILLVFVGMDLGLEGTIVENFKSVGLRVLMIPAAVVVGTLGASLLMSLVLDVTVREALAIGAGFGWYSLAPGIIMEAGHMTASAISFLHNVMRELFSILLIPTIAKYIGYVETVGLPAAAAMDIGLPIIEKATRSEIAVYSFISGVVLSTLVPILVPILIG